MIMFHRTKAILLPIQRNNPPSPSPLRRFLVERWEGWDTTDAKILSASESHPLTRRYLWSLADEETRQWYDTLSLGYGMQNGSEMLREDISSIVYGRNPRASSINVCAPAEGIFLSAHALLCRGDNIAVMTPCYQSLFEVARSIGCKCLPWKAREGRFELDDLKGILSQNQIKLVVMNLPHNPTGSMMTNKERKDIIQLCANHNIWILSDEMYRGLERQPFAMLPPIVSVYHKGISLEGVSKNLSCPGLRIGWLASQNTSFMERVAEIKDYTTISPSVVSEVLASIALRNRKKILNANRLLLQKNWGRLEGFFQKFEGSVFEHVVPPGGGTFVFPRLVSQCRPATDFLADVRDCTKVVMIPSKLFCEEGDDRVRITYGRKETVEYIDLVDDYLSSIPS